MLDAVLLTSVVLFCLFVVVLFCLFVYFVFFFVIFFLVLFLFCFFSIDDQVSHKYPGFCVLGLKTNSI